MWKCLTFVITLITKRKHNSQKRTFLKLCSKRVISIFEALNFFNLFCANLIWYPKLLRSCEFTFQEAVVRKVMFFVMSCFPIWRPKGRRRVPMHRQKVKAPEKIRYFYIPTINLINSEVLWRPRFTKNSKVNSFHTREYYLHLAFSDASSD